MNDEWYSCLYQASLSTVFLVSYFLNYIRLAKFDLLTRINVYSTNPVILQIYIYIYIYIYNIINPWMMYTYIFLCDVKQI